MAIVRKPKIGLLGLITEGYEGVFPGILERQSAYAREIVQTLSPVADVVFAGPGTSRERIEEITKEYNHSDCDAILIVLLAYSQGAYLTRALEANRLPLAMAVIQPDQEVDDNWFELDLTVNQGIHGAQDNANVIVRGGYACEFFAGNRHESRFVTFVEDFAKAAYTRTRLKSMRTAVFSRMQGMGDILSDDLAFFRTIGPEICHDTIGSIYQRVLTVTQEEIDAQMENDKEAFEVDPKLSYESHATAIREYLGFQKYLTEKGFDAYTAHFDQFADDGRFEQLPLYAASNLLAQGYGYAAEGDFMCASMVAAAHAIGDNDGNFTEMYTMDFSKKAIIFCHAGEGNYKTHKKDTRPKLIDRYLGEGGLSNPPTHIFTPQDGPATLTSLVYVGSGKFRLLIAKGEILPKNDLKNCEMPYFFFRPASGIEPCVETWLKNGGTHHEVINLTDVSRRWEMLAKMLGIECVYV